MTIHRLGRYFQKKKKKKLSNHCYVGRYLNNNKKKKKNFIHMGDWANWATGQIWQNILHLATKQFTRQQFN